MRFGLLGPLEVGGDGEPAPVAAPKQRVILACLALRPNQVVACETLIDALWPDAKPANARMALLNYVARLRRTLGPAAERLQTGNGGYRLVIAADAELDHRHAAQLADSARRAIEAGDWWQGHAQAESALALWRGEPLEDVPCEILRADFVAAFDTLRLRLEELRIDALLGAGRYETALPHISSLIVVWPLHEPSYERQLIAFYGAGWRAEALETFRTLRAVLKDELGADPTARMNRLHHLALSDVPVSALLDAWREAEPPQPASAARTDPAPQLPRRPRLLVGRDRELKELTRLLTHAATDCRVAVLTGPAGVGKTSVALAWAHAAGGHFPDGRYYLDLNGFAADGAPLSGDEAVSALLDFLDIPANSVPATPEGRMARYRAATARSRLLMVFDNARDAAQVRPLLPAGDGCRALVTSRGSLGGLVALDGAEQLGLAPLAAADSRQLLVRRLGDRRAAGQEAALEAIAERCAHLPLALSVAAARAAAMAAVPLTGLAEQLRAGALDTLQVADDAASSVRAVLSWSYLRLSSDAARLFRFLGLHPGPEITAPAASALADIAPEKAATLLSELAAMSLIAEHGDPGRYAMHSLLQAFAAELIAEDTTPEDRRAAVHRLHDYHLRAAIAADHSYTTLPVSVLADGVRLPAGLSEPVFPDENAGLDWSAAEQSVLVALISNAADGFDGFDASVWRLVAASSCGLMIRGRFHEAARQGRLALAAARRLGDRAAEGKALFLIGRALAYAGEHLTARYQLERALRIQRALADRAGQAETHRTLVTCYGNLDEPERALRHAEEYLAAARDIDHELSVCTAMDVVGSALVALGRYEEARDWCERALAETRRLGRRRNESLILDTLGHIRRELGDLDAAYELYRAAARLFNHADAAYEFGGELELAEAYVAAGSLDRAREIWTFVIAQGQHYPYIVKRAEARLAESAPAVEPALAAGRPAR